MSGEREIYGSSSQEGTQQRRTGGEGSSHDRTRKQPEWQTQPASEAASSMTGTDTAPHQASDESNDSAMKRELRQMLTKITHYEEALAAPNLTRVGLMAYIARKIAL